MNKTPTGDFDYINDFIQNERGGFFKTLFGQSSGFLSFQPIPTPPCKPPKKEIRYSELAFKVSGEIIRDVYNCYVDGMSIENIGILFGLSEDEVNEIIDAINC